jgi:DNA-binding NtrC family response regulator
MCAIFDQLAQVAPTDLTVLILGETGTGKEIVAQAIHEASRRAKGPQNVVDCGSIAANLAESILFGHEKGSFTGASERRAGAFMDADGGTLFLDELGELPLDLQPRLLRALAEKRIKSVGGSAYKKVDVRVVAATRRELEKEVNDGAFRSDLYFRIAQVVIELPALRERKSDIPAIAQRIFEQLDDPHAFERVTAQSWERLQRHDWPGNVRELKNVLTVAHALAHDGPIDVAPQLARANGVGAPRAAYPGDVEQTFADYEADIDRTREERRRSYFAALWADTNGNLSEVARRAALSRPTVRDYLRKYGIGKDPS